MARTPVLKPTPATTGLGEKTPAPDVMGTLRREQGIDPGRQKSSVSILRNNFMKQLNDNNAVQKIIDQLGQLASLRLVKLIQIGNTVFLINKYDSNGRMLPNGIVEVHLFTEDSPRVLSDRLVAASNTFRQLGYKNIVSFSTEPGITRMLQGLQEKTKGQIRVTQDVQNMAGKMVPAYRMEITL